jgi:hypothetical protein
MSTKSTLYLNENLHFYREAFDREHVYLALGKASGAIDQLVIKIPLVAWKEMRKQTMQPEERYLDLEDDELIAEAEREVGEHRDRLSKEPNSPFKGMFGLLLFGPAESSREEMIERFIENYRPTLAEKRRVS